MNSLEQVAGRIHSTDSFGAVDGPGIRFVVFLQGCPLRCLYCHNPDSWNFKEGTLRTAGDLMDEILDYKSFIQKGGVTLSGGEPLMQPEFTYALLTLCKQNGLHTAVDTSGAIPLTRTKSCIDAASMLLLDIKDIDSIDCQTLTGQSNEHAKQTLLYCEQTKKDVWIRHVCVPEYTLKEEKLHRLGEYLRSFQCIKRVELIPFHQMGMYKWDYLDGVTYQLKDLQAPSQSEMEQAKEIIRSYGLICP